MMGFKRLSKVIFATVILGHCQTWAQGLKAGDELPDLAFSEMMNYKSPGAKISDFRGKPILIDVWATWCMPCIASMPKMHELQRMFDGQIQILLLNAGEKKAVVQRFLEKRKGIKESEVTLPVVIDAGTLRKEIFNEQGVPALYWIDSSGRVTNITSSDAVTEENIRSLIANKPLTTREKSPNQGDDTIATSFTSHMERTKLEGAPLMRVFFSKDSSQNISCRSCTVLDLFRLANGEVVTQYRIPYIVPVPVSRITLDTNSQRSLGKHMRNFAGNGERFDYLLTCARGTSLTKMAERMKQELESWFELRAEKCVRSIRYLSLQCFDTLKIAYRSGELRYHIKDIEIDLNNVTISSFLSNQEKEISNGRYFFPPYPIVDDTGYQGRLGDINLQGNMRDYKSVDKALRPYGMQLKMLQGPLEILSVHSRK